MSLITAVRAATRNAARTTEQGIESPSTSRLDVPASFGRFMRMTAYGEARAT